MDLLKKVPPVQSSAKPEAAAPRPLPGWLQTIIQNSARLPRFARHVRPTFHLPGVAAINARFLEAHGISGVVWDVDGTLMGCHHSAVAEHLQRAFAALLSEPGLRHVVLSNCDAARFRELGKIFPTVPIVRGFSRPDGLAFCRRDGPSESWECEPPPEQLYRSIRKPSVPLLEYALRVLDVPAPRALVVGDQYLTDIVAASMTGVRSVKVPTLEPSSFPVAVRMLQLFDASFYRIAPGVLRLFNRP